MAKRVLVYGMTDNPGGIETYLMNVMSSMRKHNIYFDFLCDFSNISHSDLIKKNESRVFFIPAKSKGLFKHWKAIFNVLKEHKEYRTLYFNVLDAGSVFTMIIPWIMRRKIVVHSHNGETDKKKLHRLCKPIMNYVADAYLACSKVAAEFLFGTSERIQKQLVLIPNAIDMEKYTYNESVREGKKQELGIYNDQKVICHVGRLSMQKNPYGMLDIFKEVIKKDDKFVLLSIGTGELEENVKSYATELGISSYVKFLGKRMDVSELMQVADVFFLPSYYEGLPIVALEAQAAGLECVLSKNITLETDITGNVKFLDLEESKNKWAKELIESAFNQRHDVKLCIQNSEFNIKNFDKTINILKQIL